MFLDYSPHSPNKGNQEQTGSQCTVKDQCNTTSNLMDKKASLYFLFFFLKLSFIYLLERERGHKQGGGAERRGEDDSLMSREPLRDLISRP